MESPSAVYPEVQLSRTTSDGSNDSCQSGRQCRGAGKSGPPDGARSADPEIDPVRQHGLVNNRLQLGIDRPAISLITTGSLNDCFEPLAGGFAPTFGPENGLLGPSEILSLEGRHTSVEFES